MVPTVQVRLSPQVVKITMSDKSSVVSGRVKTRAARRICQIRIAEYGGGYKEESVSNVHSFKMDAVIVKRTSGDLACPEIPSVFVCLGRSRQIRITVCAEKIDVMLPHKVSRGIDGISCEWWSARALHLLIILNPPLPGDHKCCPLPSLRARFDACKTNPVSAGIIKSNKPSENPLQLAECSTYRWISGIEREIDQVRLKAIVDIERIHKLLNLDKR